jgi:hypothetical protein
MSNDARTSREMIDSYKKAGLKKIVEQLEIGNYECEGGVIANNVAFIALKELSEEGEN